MSDLERRLESAAAGIIWPEADLAAPVVSRIRSEERPAPARRLVEIVLAAAAVVLIIVATPGGRQAVADLLEVAGIRVSWGEQAAAPGAILDLGAQVTFEEAADRVSFPILVPAGSEVGEADAVFHSDFPPGGAVHLVWESDETLPAAGGTGVGLLYSQFRIHDPGSFRKTLGPGSDASDVEVRDAAGFWIEGAPHVIFYEDERGAQERARLAANVLAWEEDGVTHRIETTLGLEEALALAESLQPLD